MRIDDDLLDAIASAFAVPHSILSTQKEAMTATITMHGSILHIKTPYDPNFVVDIKKLPAQDRKWHKEWGLWIVDVKHAKEIRRMCEKHYGFGAAVFQHNQATPVVFQRKIIQQTFILDYLGTPKEREDGSVLAYGMTEGKWDLVFPDSVLLKWFNIPEHAKQPNQALTLYDELGAKQSDTSKQIQKHYHRLSKELHPNTGGKSSDAEKFMRIKYVYDRLCNPQKRKRYNAGLKLANSQTVKSKVSNNMIDILRRHMMQVGIWQPPLRCGELLIEGKEVVRGFAVSKILKWDDIVNAQGLTMSSAWDTKNHRLIIGWS